MRMHPVRKQVQGERMRLYINLQRVIRVGHYTMASLPVLSADDSLNTRLASPVFQSSPVQHLYTPLKA